MTSIELLPCPFCEMQIEIQGRIHSIDTSNYEFVQLGHMSSCILYLSTSLGNRDFLKQLINKWNTRANKEAQVLDQLKKWLDQKNNRPPTKHYTNSEYYQGQIAMLKCFTDKLEELQNA